MNSELIKLKTKSLHKKLDQHPILKNILSNNVTSEDYLNFLVLHFNALSLLNKKIQDSCTYFDFPFVSKLPKIKNDIEKVSGFCNVNAKNYLELNVYETNIEAPSSGLIYVIEGARHGNFYIKKHLKNNLEINDSAFSYLSSENPIEWSEILKVLNQSDNQAFNVVINDAVDVYELYLSLANKIQSKSSSLK